MSSFIESRCPECRGRRMVEGVRTVEDREWNGRRITLFDSPLRACLDCQEEFYGLPHAEAELRAVWREFPNYDPWEGL